MLLKFSKYILMYFLILVVYLVSFSVLCLLLIPKYLEYLFGVTDDFTSLVKSKLTKWLKI